MVGVDRFDGTWHHKGMRHRRNRLLVVVCVCGAGIFALDRAGPEHPSFRSLMRLDATRTRETGEGATQGHGSRVHVPAR